MKSICIFAVVALHLLFAQVSPIKAQVTITPSTPITAYPNTTLPLTISVAGTSGANVGALQWSITLPPTGFTFGVPAVSPAYATAGFQAFCNGAICVVVDENALPIMTDGIVLTIPILLAPGAPLGNLAVQVSSPLAVTIVGQLVPNVIAGGIAMTKVLSYCDLNGDGTVTSDDAQLVVNAIIGTSSCPITAANGGCSLQTLMSVVIAATGGVCKL